MKGETLGSVLVREDFGGVESLQRSPSSREEDHEQDWDTGSGSTHLWRGVTSGVDLQIKEIPASARILVCSPAGLRRPPATTIPITQDTAANNISFLRPTWSTRADPVRYQHRPCTSCTCTSWTPSLVKDGPTSKGTSHGGDRIGQVQNSLSVGTDDTSLLEQDREEVCDETVTG